MRKNKLITANDKIDEYTNSVEKVSKMLKCASLGSRYHHPHRLAIISVTHTLVQPGTATDTTHILLYGHNHNILNVSFALWRR